MGGDSDRVRAKSLMEGVRILSYSGGHNFSKHLHDGYVIWLNATTGERYSIQGNSSILQPGCISVIEPGVVHTNQSIKSQGSHLKSLYVTEECVDYYFRVIIGKQGEQPVRTMEITDNRFWHGFSALHSRLLLMKSPLEMECCLVDLFWHLFSHHGWQQRNRSLNRSERVLTKVVEYLQENLQRNVLLEELAKIADCSSFHLIRLFKKYKNLTPHAYLVQLRLEHGRKLLDNGSSIADAANDSGFSDQSHFSRNFTRSYGLSPGKYRKS